MRDRLTTDKTKIFARENITLMSVTKSELRRLYNEIFDRLKEYEVAEETGQIIVPPCKVGDMVYWFCMNGAMREAKVTGFGFNSSLKKGLDYCIPFTDLGKTVFLTKEEAEQALKDFKE